MTIMKKTLLIISLFIGLIANAQILGYEDIGVLLSSENTQGTARTMAMKGAFGALGGDLSAIAINPASGSIFNNSAATFTLGYEGNNFTSDFYGNQMETLHDNFNITQAGGLLVFENDYPESSFKKVAVAINYNSINNFDNNWEASSSSFIGTFGAYPNVESQSYKNITSGKQSEVNFAIATQLNDKLNLGLSFNAYNLDFSEESTREEFANDGAGYTVDSYEYFWQDVIGDGFSLGLGAIYKITQDFRLGLSYKSPVWYEIHEENNMYEEDEYDSFGYYDILFSDDPPSYYNSSNKLQTYDYDLRTPSKLTGSLAYIFDTQGLISVDISRKNYKGINLKPDFSDINHEVDNILADTYSFNLGTEWRFSEISIRGGFSYEQNPYVAALETDNKRGYALGMGYDFGGILLDVAYDYSEKTDYYNFYTDLDYIQIDGAELATKNNKVLATLTFKF